MRKRIISVLVVMATGSAMEGSLVDGTRLHGMGQNGPNSLAIT